MEEACSLMAEYSHTTLLDVVQGVGDFTVGTASSSPGIGTFLDMSPCA